MNNNFYKLKSKNKYNAKKTLVDGILFDSKAEAARYQELKILKKAGEIDYFLIQVPFILPANLKYIVDFMVVKSGEVIFEDVKGVLTQVAKNKIKQTQAIYGVKINLISKQKTYNI